MEQNRRRDSWNNQRGDNPQVENIRNRRDDEAYGKGGERDQWPDLRPQVATAGGSSSSAWNRAVGIDKSHSHTFDEHVDRGDRRKEKKVNMSLAMLTLIILLTKAKSKMRRM